MKKKIVTILTLSSLLLATNVKDDEFFLSINGGVLRIHDNSSTVGVGVGYYFYDPNSYKINNRISITVDKVDSDASFYVTSLKLDWIKNTPSLSPFVGFNIGSLYFDDNGNSYSTGVWGGQAGLIYQITNSISLDVEGFYQKAYHKKDIWNTPLKQVKAGLEFSF